MFSRYETKILDNKVYKNLTLGLFIPLTVSKYSSLNTTNWAGVEKCTFMNIEF